jgi:signal recognition particle receptor subunit beta
VLYEVFVQCHKQNNKPALLVVCNKSDVKGALSAKDCEAMLQKQLDRLKETRHALVTANSEGDEDVMIGVDGQAFDFEADAPCSVEFTSCSVKGGDLGQVTDFIASAFPASA